MAGIVQINNIGWWLKQHFGEKVVKLSLDGGFTCPNRDGTCGTGGCIFCSAEGSGELASFVGTEDPALSGQKAVDPALSIPKTVDPVLSNSKTVDPVLSNPKAVGPNPYRSKLDIAHALEEQIQLRKEKWPNVRSFIAYFQNHTNTYAPVSELREKFEAALDQPGIIGLAIATRPDCLPEDVLDLLSELKEKTFLWVELGLQTIHGDNINRGYGLSVYDKAVKELTDRGIRVVTHLILGLPGESKEDMAKSVRYVCRSPIFGLKLHLLNVVKGAPMEAMYPGYTPFASPEEYISLVCDLLEIIPEDITIHRLTGDVPRKLLVAPPWSYKKRTILNGIAHELKLRGSTQGCKL